MRRSLASLFVLFVLFVIAGLAAPAVAQEDPFAHLRPSAPKAIEYMKEGNRFYKLSLADLESGRVERANERRRTAITFYEKSLSVQPSPIVVFNLAQVHRELGEYEEAIGYYERFMATAELTEAQLDDVRKRIASARGEKELAEAKRAPPPEPEPIVEPSPPEPRLRDDTLPARSTAWYADWLGWTLAGTGVALGVSGGGLFANASRLDDDADEAASQAEAKRLRSKADDRRVAAGVVVGVGVTAIVAGALKLVLHDDDARPDAAASVSVGRRAVSLTVRF